jgi:UDP-N-acetylmuramate: L-alanyl-gamma-D-glutamyl-meso-diaminopimelate ligase
LAAAGRPAYYERDAAAIVERLVPILQPNDIVTVFSNGGFDGIHEKLLAALRAS